MQQGSLTKTFDSKKNHPTIQITITTLLSVLMFLSLMVEVNSQPSISEVENRNSANGKQCFNRTDSSNSAPAGALRLSVVDPIQNFESGSKTIVASPQQIEQSQSNLQESISKRYHCFNISFLYLGQAPIEGQSYEAVVSIQNIESYQDAQGLDFSVRIINKQPTYLQGLFVISSTAEWAQVEVHYVVTVREDFRVGEFIPSAGELLGLGLSNCHSASIQLQPQDESETSLILEHKLIKPWTGPGNTNSIFALPFLSGIKTLDRELNAGFGRSSFEPQSGLIRLSLSTKQVQNPIENLVISYLVVSMESDFQITNIYDLNYIPSDINVFVGMTGINTLVPFETQTDFIGEELPSGLLRSSSLVNQDNRNSVKQDLLKKSFHHLFDVQGLVIQSNANLDLLFSAAPSDHVSDASAESTVLECISSERCQGYDGYMNYYQNQNGYVFHSECVLCERFASYNKVTQSCQCRDLYVRDLEGKCVLKTSENEVTEEQQPSSKCPKGFEFFKGKCYRVIWGEPESKEKQQDQILGDADKSEMFAGLNQINGLSQSDSLCSAAKNERPDSSNPLKCICNAGAFRINGQCQYCHQNAYFNGESCQCLRGFIGDGKFCEANSVSGANIDSALGLVPTFIRDELQNQQQFNLSAQSDQVQSPSANILETMDGGQGEKENQGPQNQGGFVLGRIDLSN